MQVDWLLYYKITDVNKNMHIKQKYLADHIPTIEPLNIECPYDKIINNNKQ